MSVLNVSLQQATLAAQALSSQISSGQTGANPSTQAAPQAAPPPPASSSDASSKGAHGHHHHGGGSHDSAGLLNMTV